jgi:hypothetical protein
MLFGLHDYGIAFDDSTFFQHYAATNQEGQNSTSVDNLIPAGPLAGGTPVNLFIPGLTPDAWFGPNRASVNVSPQQVAAHALGSRP